MNNRQKVGLAAAWVLALICQAIAGQADPGPAATGDGTFPEVNEVLQGRSFDSKFDRDVFFLQRIRDNYHVHWPALLAANIVVSDYVHAPDKLLRFVDELGTAMAGMDDVVAITNLALITSDPVFYANTNAYRPGILQATAWALIRIGARGCQVLAESFSENHYRTDPASLEVLADAIGRRETTNTDLAVALERTAFIFTTAKGGSYPRCTKQATANLVRLPGGSALVANHLDAKEVFADPGRFQSVVEGIAAAHAAGLTTNLVELRRQVTSKLGTSGIPPSSYRDDLAELEARLDKAIGQLQASEAQEQAGSEN